MIGRRYKLWWSRNGASGVGAMVKEDRYENEVEARRESDRVMSLVVVFEEDELRLICGYAPQSLRSLEEKHSSYDEL